MPYARMRDGADLHYLEVGRGPTCMLLHGFAMPAALWLPFVAPLTTRFRFVMPNLRGFGGSHRVNLSNDCLLTQHADDIADLIETLDLNDIRLAGLSMGACTALQYNRLYGFGRVRSYLNIDQSPCVRNGRGWRHGLLGADQARGFAKWAALMAELDRHRHLPYRKLPRDLRRQLWEALSDFLAYAFHDKPWWLALGKLTRIESVIRRIAPLTNWTIYFDCLRSYLVGSDYDWRPSLRAIDVPMTIAIGMRSRMYPAAGQLAIRNFVPHARVEKFYDTGHAVPFEAPLQFSRLLRTFLLVHSEDSARRQAA